MNKLQSWFFTHTKNAFFLHETEKLLSKKFAFRYTLFVLLYVAIYISFDYLGRSLDVGHGISPWYPNAGLNLSVLLYAGPVAYLNVFVGSMISAEFSFVTHFPHYVNIIWSLIKALLYTCECVVMLVPCNLDLRFPNSNSLKIFLLVCSVSHIIVGIGFNTTLYFLYSASVKEFAKGVFNWLLGDVAGIVNVVPLVFVTIKPLLSNWMKNAPLVISKKGDTKYTILKMVVYQCVIICVSLYMTLGLSFIGNQQIRFYFGVGPLFYYTVKFGRYGATLSIFFYNLAVITVLTVIKLEVDSFDVQMYIMTSCITTLFLAIILEPLDSIKSVDDNVTYVEQL